MVDRFHLDGEEAAFATLVELFLVFGVGEDVHRSYSSQRLRLRSSYLTHHRRSRPVRLPTRPLPRLSIHLDCLFELLQRNFGILRFRLSYF